VATFLGALLATAWPVGLLVCFTWLGTALLFRVSSLAALVAAAFAPVFALAFGREDVALLALFLTALIYWLHRSNIDRLMKGQEPRIGAKTT
jgi:glycerol-3-phosphate acyltransferase PlsY